MMIPSANPLEIYISYRSTLEDRHPTNVLIMNDEDDDGEMMTTMTTKMMPM